MLCQALSKRLGRTELMGGEEKEEPVEGIYSFLLHEHLVHYEEEKVDMPAQVLLCPPVATNPALFEDPLVCSQFWTCPDKEGLISRCRYTLMASNFMSATLPLMEEYGILADYADILLELFPDCIALYWPHSQKLMPRGAFENSQWRRKELHFLDGGINVRFFRITGTEDMLVDTLGLTAIGLPDLQCHFHTLDHNDVIWNINNPAAYLYEHGDIVEDGHTVEGLHPGEKWKCRREDSLVGPLRMVLDVHVGACAAGNRPEEY